MSFSEFKNCECTKCGPNCQCSPKIQVDSLLPKPSFVFLKLISIHAGVAILTLSACPQFGVRLFGHGLWSLFDAFMFFGHTICTILCGAFFIGTSLAMTRLIFDLDEWAIYQKYFWANNAGLIVISLMSLAALGAHLQLSHLGLWLVGVTAICLVLRSKPDQKFSLT